MGARSRLALFALSLIVLVSHEWRAARFRASRKAAEALRKASAVTQLSTDGIVAYIRSLKYEPAQLMGTALDQPITRQFYFWTK